MSFLPIVINANHVHSHPFAFPGFLEIRTGSHPFKCEWMLNPTDGGKPLSTQPSAEVPLPQGLQEEELRDVHWPQPRGRPSTRSVWVKTVCSLD